MEGITAYVDEFIGTHLGVVAARVFFGNTISEYVVAFVVFLLAFVAFKLLRWFVLHQLNQIARYKRTDLGDTLIKMVRSFQPPFYTFLAFWMAFQLLSTTAFAEKIVSSILIIWVVFQVVIAAGVFIEDLLLKHFAKDQDPTTLSALRILCNIAKGVIWGLGIILLLSNLGVNVTSLIAGVGIGGIAIALALQGVLSDLFASFSIYFDKPFKVGDFISAGDTLGTVKHIGVKSTRIESLSGEEVVVSNQELTSVRIQNYMKMEERRVLFSFRLPYDTPHEKLATAPTMVRETIEAKEKARFDRAHFKGFGDAALDFEVVYYVLSSNYNEYMDIQQAINLGIVERLQQAGIGFAPAHTVSLGRPDSPML